MERMTQELAEKLKRQTQIPNKANGATAKADLTTDGHLSALINSEHGFDPFLTANGRELTRIGCWKTVPLPQPIHIRVSPRSPISVHWRPFAVKNISGPNVWIPLCLPFVALAK
jgi:hypothetical protein